MPAEGWRRLRMNLACVDTLCIDPAEGTSQRDGKNTGNDRAGAGRFSISRLFPALDRGPTVILGNPPYADLGRRADLAELGCVYETVAIKPQPNAEIYLPFIEQMIRLADQEICVGALILPLSVACNVGPQFSTARELISKTRGRWRLAFFDREPHALFGEDVKTRNTIMLWSRSPSDTRPVLSTGPLRKWRGDSRAAMFRSLRFTGGGRRHSGWNPKNRRRLPGGGPKAAQYAAGPPWTSGTVNRGALVWPKRRMQMTGRCLLALPPITSSMCR